MSTRAKKRKKQDEDPAQDPHLVPGEFRILEAEADNDFQLIEAAADTEDKPDSLRRFKMTAYTGGKLPLPNFPYPVVADLSGMRIPAKSRPILRDHDSARIVGHTETIDINASTLRLAGVISGTSDSAHEVADSADNGFPWQASIGAQASKVAFVDRGETVEVNGRKFTGPLYVARKSVLREVSFVALGADDHTSATLAATTLAADSHPADNSNTSHSEPKIEEHSMKFEEWVQARGFVVEDLNETQTVSLTALFEADTTVGVDSPEIAGTPAPEEPSISAQSRPASTVVLAPTTSEPVEPGPVGPGPQQPESTVAESTVAELRAELATEMRRVGDVRRTCGGRHDDIEAKAIEEGWDVTRTELEVLRADRPQAPAMATHPIHRRRGPCRARMP